MKHKSLKDGWITKAAAVKLFNVDASTMNRWHNKWPECFDEINGKNANVNVEMLKAKVNKL